MPDPWILGFSLITVAVTIWMGFRSAKSSKSAADFFVAGRSVSVGWNASAISGEYLSAASFMGVAGMVMSSGYDALWYPVCYACGYLFLLLFIAGPLRRFGAYTIPDFAEGRYDSPIFRRIAVLFVLFIGFFYTMPQMKGAGTTLAYVFKDINFLGQRGLPYWVGVVVVGAVITLNVALGGMKGITLVQAFQYWIKMFAISVPIFVLASVYGGYGKQLSHQQPVVPRSNAVRTGTAPPVLPVDEPPLLNGRPQPIEISLGYGGPSPRTEPDMALLPEGPPPLLPVWDELRATFRANGSLKDWLRGVSRAFGARTSSFSPPPAGMTLATIVGSIYPMFLVPPPSTFTVYFSPGLNGNSALIKPNTNLSSTTARRGPKGIRDLLAANGYSIVHLRHDAVKVYRTCEAARYANEDPVAANTPYSGGMNASGKPQKVDPAGTLANGGERPNQNPRSRPHATEGGLPELEVERSIAVPPMSLQPPSSSYAVVLMPTPTDLIKIGFGGTRENSDSLRVLTNAADVGIALKVGDQFVNVPAPLAHAVVHRNIENARATLSSNHPFAMRMPMPQKAPADSSWLNPFGPLTTKAAKAAKVEGEAARPYALLYTYSLIIALVCGTAGLPHILVRFYTNPDGVAAKRTTMWVMILIGIFYVFPPVFGVMGRNLMPSLYDGSGVNGTDGIVLKLPTVLGDRLGPLGSILSGIACAGAFAAFMSTFSGLLVSMTGALAHDVYGRILRPQSTPEQRLRMFKLAAVLIGTVAIGLGTLVENFEINFMVGQAFAIAAASYFPLLFMSVWWRGMTTRGAATGMLTGGLLAVAAISLTSWTTFITAQGAKFAALGRPEPAWFAALKGYSLSEFWAGHPLLRILCEQPAIWAVPLAILLMIVVSKRTRHQIPADIREKMLVLHAPEALGLRQDYIRDHHG